MSGTYTFVELTPGGFTLHKLEDKKIHRLDGFGDPDMSQVADGALVVSTRTAAIRRDYGKNSIMSPLVDVSKEDGHIDTYLSPKQANDMAIHIEAGSYLLEHMAIRSAGVFPGPLDEISPNDYAKWWQDRGGRIGTVLDGSISWRNDN